MTEPENQAEALDEKALAVATQAVTTEIDRYWADDSVLPGHRPVAEAAIRAYLAAIPEAPAVPVGVINGSPIAEFVRSYQFDASDEGYVYTPTFSEQCMIEDAICSFISDGVLLNAALQSSPPVKAAAVDGEKDTHEFVADPYRPGQCLNCARHRGARVHDAALASQHAVEGEAVAPACGLADPSYHDCKNMKEVGGGLEGERYRCAVCGKGYFLDYEDMK